MSEINKMFPIRFFAKSDMEKILKDDTEKMLILFKNTPEGSQIYKTFNDDLSTFLMKLPAGNVKEQVQNVLNKDLIYVAVAKLKIDHVFARLFLTLENKLAGIGLAAQVLGIDPINGSIESADNCVYAIYFELCRAAVLLNQSHVKQNRDLHKLMSTYLYFIFMKCIGADKVFLAKQKDFVHLLSIYIYYKYYVKEKHSYILAVIEKYYKDFINQDHVDEFLPFLDKMSIYDSVKDFPKMLIDAKLYSKSPNVFILNLLKMLKPTSFYYLMSSLDGLVALAVTSRYPFDLISRYLLVDDKIQSAVEEIIVRYINQIKFDLTAIKKNK